MLGLLLRFGLVLVSVGATSLSEDSPSIFSLNGRGLVTFALVRGGSDYNSYKTFMNSRACLREAVPPAIDYDDVAFHEGNIPADVQLKLKQFMCESPPLSQSSHTQHLTGHYAPQTISI